MESIFSQSTAWIDLFCHFLSLCWSGGSMDVKIMIYLFRVIAAIGCFLYLYYDCNSNYDYARDLKFIGIFTLVIFLSQSYQIKIDELKCQRTELAKKLFEEKANKITKKHSDK